MDNNNKAIQALNKEIQNNMKIENEQSGSINQLQASLSKMTAEYNSLSEAERKTTKGADLQKSIADTTAKLKEEEEALGNHRRSVGDYEKATRNLRAELKQYVAQLQEMKLAGKEGSQEYQELVEKAGELKDAIGDVSDAIKNQANDTSVMAGLNEGLQVLVGTYGLYESALSAAGLSNEELGETMKKLTMVMTSLSSLQAIYNSLQSQSSLSLLAHKTAALAAAAAQKILGTATAATSLSFKLLKGTIISTGIGVLLVLVGELIAHWDDLVGWFKKGTDGMSGFGKAVDKIKEIAMGVFEAIKTYILTPFRTLGKIMAGDWSGALDEIKNGIDVVGNYQKGAAEQMAKNEEASAEARAKAAAKLQSDKLKGEIETMERQLEVDNARGLSAEDLYNREKQILEKKVQAYELALKAIGTANAEAYAEQAKALEDIIQKGLVLEAKEAKRKEDADKAAAEKAAQTAKAAADKARSEREKRNAEILKAEQDLEKERINAMQDGAEKEIASVRLSLQTRLEEIKGNSGAETELRKQLTENAEREIAKTEKKYRDEADKTRMETEIALTGAYLEQVQKGTEAEFDLRKQLLKERAAMEISSVEKSVTDEDLRAAKILEINAKLENDLKGIDRDRTNRHIENIREDIKNEELAVTRQYEQGAVSKNEYEKRMRDIGLNSIEEQIAVLREAGESTVDLELELSERRIAIAEKEKAQKMQYLEEGFNFATDIGNRLFDGQRARLEQQMEDLNHYYTTDAEAAKNNKDLKLITEEEMQRRQLEIKRKQAKAEKEQAVFNIILSTAMSIAKTAATMGFPLAIPFIAMAAVSGALQLSAVTSKPLPKYAKGRKGGRGEFALTGEYGPELLWLPAGASVMPHRDTRKALAGRTDVFDRWDMPRPENNPPMPRVNQTLINQYNESRRKEERIDYELLGKSVAKYMKFPKQKRVSIRFDRSGLTVAEGNTTTTILNSKYSR